MGETIGSVLHGAYGDYYEQMICLKHFKRQNPDSRLVLFFASASRLRELRVFDLGFADEVHLATEIERVPVDRFLQYQVQDPELREEVLSRLSPDALLRFDRQHNLKPWTTLRRIDLRREESTVGLSEEGRGRLPQCMAENEVEGLLSSDRFTVGFLWRYRGPGGAISPAFQTAQEVVLCTKSALLSELAERYGAHAIIAGMNVKTTAENRERVDAKFTESRLDLDPSHCTYLKGLSWGLELEILRRCTLCVVMPSGFSEALWMLRSGPTVLVDAPPVYLAKLLWNRMPLFDIRRPSTLLFQLRQPHTPQRVLRYLKAQGLLPPARPTADARDGVLAPARGEPATQVAATKARSLPAEASEEP